MDQDEGVEHARDAAARDGRACQDVQAFAIPFIERREQPDPSYVVKCLGHEAQRQGPVLRGTPVAALFYTLCGSAKLVGVDPHTYLLTATDAALATQGTVTLPDAVLTVTV